MPFHKERISYRPQRSRRQIQIRPPIEATSFLQETIGKHYEIPIEVFLHYIDAIAWQEDVKYYTLGRGVNTDIGRTNNLLTYAHFCACLLKRAHWAEMLNRYSMGVSPHV